MEILQEAKDTNKKGFLSHVFSTTEDGKAEILNTVQYAVMGVAPIVALNKTIQRFIPDADPESGSLEILAEILIQLVIMFCGVIVIHRAITYFPTYSGFKYDNLTLTNVILAFLILVLSIQTKLGLKVNILFDRLVELWEGPDSSKRSIAASKKNVRFSQPIANTHMISRADYYDDSSVQSNVFPPAPVATTKQNSLMENIMGGSTNNQYEGPSMMNGPMAANTLLGGSFGSLF